MSKHEFPIPKFCKARQWPRGPLFVVRVRDPLLLATSPKAGRLLVWPPKLVPAEITEKRLEKFVDWCSKVIGQPFNLNDIMWTGGPLHEFLMMRAVTGADWEGILQPRTGKIWRIESRSQNSGDRRSGDPSKIVLLPDLDPGALDYYAEFWKRAEENKAERERGEEI